MADTRIGEVIDAIIATLTAVPALADPVAVYDGPVVSGDYATRAVFVGYDGDPDGEFRAASISQTYTGAGHRVKDETVTVNCVAVAWSGDTDIKTLRDGCLTLLAAVNDGLRDNPSQGLPAPASFNLNEGALFQGPGPSGLQVRMPFTITATVRI